MASVIVVCAYTIAVGPRQGQKAFTLQTLPAITLDDMPGELANSGGFSLHAGIAARADQRAKLERLCRYVARSAVADSRLSLTRQGQVRYSLKTLWRDSTTHVVFEPLDFIARLAALIPRPRVNITRYHGVFAPNSHFRAQVTPARRGKRVSGDGTVTEPHKHRTMTWAKRLKRVFRIPQGTLSIASRSHLVDVEVCEQCGGGLRLLPASSGPTSSSGSWVTFGASNSLPRAGGRRHRGRRLSPACLLCSIVLNDAAADSLEAAC